MKRKRKSKLLNGARAIMAARVHPKKSRDFFCTPPFATRALCEVVLPHIGVGLSEQTIIEPACGAGHMAEVLKEYGWFVSATDKYEYGYADARRDFLKDHMQPRMFDWIVTNPPFQAKTEAFVLRALELAYVGVAMFVRLQWLETTGRYERIFHKHPPTLIAFFAERVNLCKGRWEPHGSTATAYVWLVWVKGKKPMAPFWIPPGQKEKLTRPDDIERFTKRPVVKKDRQHLAASPARPEPAPRHLPSLGGAGSQL